MPEKIKVLEKSYCQDVHLTLFNLVFSKFIDQKLLFKHAYEYCVEYQLIAFIINHTCFQNVCVDADICICY